MLRNFRQVILTLAFAGMAVSAPAFSLLGPFEAFQTPARGYNPFNTDIGAPKNRLNNEEYRWNLPLIVYGFDESFDVYFGPTGVAAVSNAFEILNQVPAVSQMSSNLGEFPTDSRRENSQASALRLLDLKSTTMSLVLNELGLASPERWVWAILDSRVINLGGGFIFTNYLVGPRNFDPITFSPTPYVNDVLYTYRILNRLLLGGGSYFDAIEFAADTTAANAYGAVASGVDDIDSVGLGFGAFYTGLTRDDIGGLRYLLAKDNLNNEQLPGGAGITFAPTFTTNPIAVPILATNIVITITTNPPDPFGDGGGVFTIVTNIATNTFAVYTNLVTTNFISNNGFRGGVDKITFVQMTKEFGDFGSFVPITNQFSTIIFTNIGGTNLQVTQLVTRVITQPDFLFVAGPTPFLAGSGVPSQLVRSVPVFINTNASRAGPGIIQPQVRITYNNLAPFIDNHSPFALIEDVGRFGSGYAWGSFDVTTNPPVVYPQGMSLQFWQQLIQAGP